MRLKRKRKTNYFIIFLVIFIITRMMLKDIGGKLAYHIENIVIKIDNNITWYNWGIEGLIISYINFLHDKFLYVTIFLIGYKYIKTSLYIFSNSSNVFT